MSSAAGVGHFISWDGGSLLIGHALDVLPMHAHYAIQVAFGIEPSIGFRPNDREDWTEYDAVIIASRKPHSMDATRVRFNAVLFVEPETREGRTLSERHLTGVALQLCRKTRSRTRCQRSSSRGGISEACRRSRTSRGRPSSH